MSKYIPTQKCDVPGRWTQKKIANALGVTVRTVQRYRLELKMMPRWMTGGMPIFSEAQRQKMEQLNNRKLKDRYRYGGGAIGRFRGKRGGK